jgi:hypothetical protein
MKNLLNAITLSIALLFATSAIYAQSGNSTFEIFSENGDPFILIMNGVQQNNQAQTNVKLQNLGMASYKIRVIFQNAELGALNDKINLDYASHQTYSIKLKKISNFEKNLKSATNTVAKDLALKDAEEANAKSMQIENENSKYVIKMISKVPLAAPPAPVVYNQTPPPAPARTNTQVTTTTIAPPAQQTTVVQQTTTTTGNGANINTNSNMNGANVSMNINLNGALNTSSSYTETSTTTVHTTGAPVQAQQTNVYVMPGYSGPTGCPWPMNEGDFANAKNSVASKSFEDSKLTMAKQIFDHNCLLSSQVRDMMSVFDFEATKLEFAKYAYGRTFDIGNYYKVNDVFDFETSISDLNAYINNYRR